MRYDRRGVSDESISTIGTLKGARSATIPCKGTDHSAFRDCRPDSHRHVTKRCLVSKVCNCLGSARAASRHDRILRHTAEES
jgi:hypothetical protein